MGSSGDLGRERFAGQHRLVDRRLAVDDDAVGRDLLAGPHDEAISDLNLLDSDDDLLAVPPESRVSRAELEQGLDRRGRAPPGPRLEIAAEHDQRRDDGTDLEVGVGFEPADQHDSRPRPCGDGAE